MKFWVLKKKFVVIFLVCLIFGFGCCAAFSFVRPTYSPKTEYKIVIDAGHGGIDGGSVGKKTKVVESKLNLQFAKNLKSQLEKVGVYCVLTRSGDDGLYDEGARSLKKSDMLKRKQIIEEAGPNLVVSIHMNSFPLSSARGAQVYYKEKNESGESLACEIQGELNKVVDGNKKKEKPGDFYLVTCTDLPAVLIECGFLSNPEEEILLQQSGYQTKICKAILSGILGYLAAA